MRSTMITRESYKPQPKYDPLKVVWGTLGGETIHVIGPRSQVSQRFEDMGASYIGSSSLWRDVERARQKAGTIIL